MSGSAGQDPVLFEQTKLTATLLNTVAVRTVVLADTRPFTPLCVRGAGGKETQLWAKEVKAEGRRDLRRAGAAGEPGTAFGMDPPCRRRRAGSTSSCAVCCGPSARRRARRSPS